MHNLKIPPASSKKFPKKTHSGHHACVTKQSPVRFSRIIARSQNSTCLKQAFSSTKETTQRTPCVRSKTMSNAQPQNSTCLKQEFSITKENTLWTPCVRKNCTSSKFHLPQQRIFRHARKQMVHTMRASHCLNKLKKAPAPSNNFPS